jgi:P4 family phage/plasmid primase-like protien
MWTERCKSARSIATKLKSTSFKENVMRECSEIFYKEKFEESLDQRCNLLGFNNGVYDLDAMCFRDGQPDDHVSFSTGFDYQELDMSSHVVDDLKLFFSQVFVNEAVRNYVLNMWSSVLHGRIREERFHIWTGDGSNGKSCCVDLFERCLGDYCCKFPITLLTQKRAASNAATSELARSKGKRFACLQEPSEDERLNIGLMKEMTGGDKIFARQLYKEPIEFKPQFKMILTCNHLPNVPSDDGGTWRRIRVVHFKSKFTENPNPDNPFEFKIDHSLISKFDTWRVYLMGMLLERFKEVAVHGYPEPPEVMECTKQYQRDNDVLTDFFESCIVQVDPNINAQPLCIDTAFEELKFWARSENLPCKIPKKKELQSFLCKRIGGGERKTWNTHALQNSNNSSASNLPWLGQGVIATRLQQLTQ